MIDQALMHRHEFPSLASIAISRIPSWPGTVT